MHDIVLEEEKSDNEQDPEDSNSSEEDELLKSMTGSSIQQDETVPITQIKKKSKKPWKWFSNLINAKSGLKNASLVSQEPIFPNQPLIEYNEIDFPPDPDEFILSGVARLPIRVEKEIYKMSHAKIVESGRSLCDQVLISNFMAYILSVNGEMTLDRIPHKKRNARKRKSSSLKVKEVEEDNALDGLGGLLDSVQFGELNQGNEWEKLDSFSGQIVDDQFSLMFSQELDDDMPLGLRYK